MNTDLTRLRIAALFGFLAVALGAMGAHGLEKHWEATLDAATAAYRMDVWKTASFYHAVHSVVLLVLAYSFVGAGKGTWAFRCFTAGILIFSGSLYVLCATGISKLGAVTPVGGLLLMAGWILLMFPGKRQASV